MELLVFGERLWRIVAPLHYRIPRYIYALAVVASILVALAGAPAVGVPTLVIAVVGVIRWQFDRQRGWDGLIVARFSGPEQVAEETQRIIVASLMRELSADEAKLVHPVSVVVGPNERRFAAVLRRRLHAKFVLHGRVSEERSVYSTVMQPIREGIFHIDFHTWDTSVMKAPWRSIFNDLSPERYVIDEAYPYEFTHELESVVRGTAGQLALANEDYSRAERLLRSALSVAPQSTSHQIDQLRVDLSKALISQDKLKEAIPLLRQRAAGHDPAPDLFRQLAMALFLIYGLPNDVPEPIREQAQAEALKALRAAAKSRSDPRLELTKANLVLALRGDSPEDRAERKILVEELLSTKGPYSKAWYLFRALGADAYHAVTKAREIGNQQIVKAESEKAAHWYSVAIRNRPRIKLLVPGEQGLELKWMRLPPSPVLYANLYDALWFAGNQEKAKRMERRANRLRAREYRKGIRKLRHGRWSSAQWDFMRACVGWRYLWPEIEAEVMASVALMQLGNHEAAIEMWQKAKEFDAGRATAAREWASAMNLPNGLP